MMVRFFAQASGKPDCLLLLVPDPGHPRPGNRWHLRSLRVVADSPTTIPNGNGDEHVGIYVGIPPSSNGALNAVLDVPEDDAADWRGTIRPLPAVAFFGLDQIVVETGEVLYAVVYCGSEGTEHTYTMTGSATEERQT